MKRCPQCLFLYPESDERCDFDQMLLEVVDDAAVEAATSQPKAARRKSKALPIAVGIFMIAVVAFGIYFGFSRQVQKTTAATESSIPVLPVPVVETVASQSPTESPSPSPSPTPSPSPSPKTESTTVSTSHTRATTAPVSTSGPGIGARQRSKPVIMLTSGGKIDADEVWRTKDGVWYRRNGMVTLLKRNQVKSIVTR